MKNIKLTQLFGLFVILVLTSCGKDNSTTPVSQTDYSQFYRMESFEVETDPAHREVRILFQVKDNNYNGVAGLTVDDLNVFENDGSIDTEGDLTLAPNTIPSSLKTVLLLDLTRSVEGLVAQIKAACNTLIDHKLPEQAIAIYTFDSDTYLLQDFTTNTNLLKAAINGMPETDLVNSTNLYGAVRDVSDTWTDVFTLQAIEDGSLIIFTDGRHNATPNITLDDAIESIGIKKRYVAALNSPDLDEVSLKSLAGQADRYFKADDVAGLEAMFIQIQNEIQRLSQSIYYLFYQSPITDPTPHDNDLRVEIEGNTNKGDDNHILESFNSQGFGD